jgi:hypothetical protein
VKRKACPRCGFIGDGLFFDYVEGQRAPDELYDLPLLPETDGSIRQCVECAQYFELESKYDSDIFQPTDSLEVRPVELRVVEQIIRWEKKKTRRAAKQLAEFKEKALRFARRRFRFSILEKYIYGAVLDAGPGGSLVISLAQQLKYRSSDVLTILDRLAAAGVVRREDKVGIADYTTFAALTKK